MFVCVRVCLFVQFHRCINKPNDVKMNRNEIIATFETGSILKVKKQSEKSITKQAIVTV